MMSPEALSNLCFFCSKYQLLICYSDIELPDKIRFNFTPVIAVIHHSFLNLIFSEIVNFTFHRFVLFLF